MPLRIKMNITYNYSSERNRIDRINIYTSVKGTEKIEKDRNYSIGTECISVHLHTELKNICVLEIFLYNAQFYTSFLLTKRVLE